MKGPGSEFMRSFETVKQKFGRNAAEENDIRELAGLRLDIPDSEFYDEEEDLVNLT